MKFLISTILLLAFSVTTFAQNLVFSTPSHLEEVTYTAEFRNYDIKFKTPQPQETVYKWDRVSLTLPETWNFSLCDHMGCYAGVPPTGTMTTITLEQSQDGMEGFFKLTVNTDDFVGEGWLVLYVYEANNIALGDTVTFHLTHADATGITAEIIEKTEPMIYPNPASDKLNIALSNLAYMKSVTVHNAIGKTVLTNQKAVLSKEISLNVSDLEEGIYFVSIETMQGDVLTQKIIVR